MDLHGHIEDSGAWVVMNDHKRVMIICNQCGKQARDILSFLLRVKILSEGEIVDCELAATGR